MKRWTERERDGCVSACIDRKIDGQVNGQRWIEAWIDRQIDGQKTDRRKYVGQEKLSNQLIEGQAEEQCDRQTS